MKEYRYMTRAALLDAIADGHAVRRADVRPRVLNARVWIAGAGAPGCLYDSGPYYFPSRADAIEGCLFLADSGDDDYAPRGMRAALKRHGIYYHRGRQFEVSAGTVGGIL